MLKLTLRCSLPILLVMVIGTTPILASGKVSKSEYLSIQKKFQDFFSPHVSYFGYVLKLKDSYKLSFTGARVFEGDATSPSGSNWEIEVTGGFSKIVDLDADSLILTYCHELGHLLGGLPTKRIPGEIYSNEGQADYFATHGCAREIWKNETETNKKFLQTVSPYAKQLCDLAWSSSDDRNLCYRISVASLTFARVLVSANAQSTKPPVGSVFPKFETPSEKVATGTLTIMYPTVQCRLDTLLAGALCPKEVDFKIIPGIKNGDLSGREAFERNSCFLQSDPSAGHRPRCWFDPTDLNAIP